MESGRGEWPRLIRLAGQVSDAAVELSALSGRELPGLAAFLAHRTSLAFVHVSVHGPAKDWLAGPEELARELQEQMPAYVTAIVMHPETLTNPDPFAALGHRLVLENMDPFKHGGRTVDELAPFFDALPQAGFCFDIAHACLNDPSMRVAHDLLDAYLPRLREVHLSSIDADGKHVPLRLEDVTRFRPILQRCRDVPWILEAELPSD
jgi:sugar phosphate isomerase/epimerase